MWEVKWIYYTSNGELTWKKQVCTTLEQANKMAESKKNSGAEVREI